MKKNIGYILLIIMLCFGCEDNNFELTGNADEYFFLRNDGADMPVWVKGNTQSKVFIVVLHGGPGGGSVGKTDLAKSYEILEDDYAVVYWDQRGAGITQGNYKKNTINVEHMVEDLDKLLVLLKDKYGSDISIFLQGISWGGYLGFAYLLEGDNQDKVNGWISQSGAHDISLTANASRRMLLKYGREFIEKGIYTSEWQKIVNWCEENDTIITTQGFRDVNAYAFEVEDYIMDSIAETDIDMDKLFKRHLFGVLSRKQFNVNLTNTETSSFSLNFIDLTLTPELHKITLPTLLITGKFDFIVPNEVMYDAYNHISSEQKEILVFDKSAHAPYILEPVKFASVVKEFIEQHK